MKICTGCEREKDEREFNVRTLSIDGLSPICRDCKKLKDSEYRKKKRREISDKKKEWYNDNKERVLGMRIEYYNDNKEEIRKKQELYYTENKERIYETNKKYRRNNREKRNSFEKNKRKTDVNYALVIRNRNRVNNSIRNKSNSSKELLGCEIDFYKDYLEEQFTDGMSWDKLLNGEWHIDHIRPISSFDLLIEDDVESCFNYKNTQPLWAEDNLRKGGKWLGDI